MRAAAGNSFCSALADGRPLYSRPPLGNYDEQSLRGLYFSHDSIKLTRHTVPVGAVEQTEVENIPFTSYGNSLAFTFLKMVVSVAYGSAAMTLNLYDHLGSPMEADPDVGHLLCGKKPFLNALADVAAAPGRLRGVRFCTILGRAITGGYQPTPATGNWPKTAMP